MLSSVSGRNPVVTVKAFAVEMECRPTTSTVRGPTAAVRLIDIVAMAVPFGWTATGPNWFSGAPPTEIPGPNLAVVPLGKVVLAPVIVTCNVKPVPPEAGLREKLGDALM